MKTIVLLTVIILHFSFGKDCGEYFNPDNFNEAPQFLQELLDEQNNYKSKQKFTIVQKEIYKLSISQIATTINSDFEGFWSDWVGDAYEVYLTPEYTLFKYGDFYCSLKVTISGVQGDATRLKGTVIKYQFYNYTSNVKKYIECKNENTITRR